MKTKLLFSLLAAFAVAMSCGSDDATTDDDSGNVDDGGSDGGSDYVAQDVSFTASGVTFSTGDEIAVSALSSDLEIFAQDVSYTYGDSGFTSSSPIQLTEEDMTLSYVAVTPYTALSASETISFTVKADQSASGAYEASDLIVGVAVASSSATPTLTFSSVLPTIVATIKSSEVETDDAVLKLSLLATTEYDVTTNTISATGSATEITMADNGDDSFKAVVAPQSISSDDVIGTITVGGLERDIYLDKSTDLVGGVEYSATLDILKDRTEVTLTLGTTQIKDWDKGTIAGLE